MGHQSLKDRVYIVTGGGGAIAQPIVRAFAGAGARLALVDRNEASNHALAAEVKGLGLGADLSSLAGASEMVAKVVAQFGQVDGVIHTVGGFAMGKILDADPAEYDRMFDLNVRSLFYVVRSVLPSLLASGNGFVAALSSEPGWTGRSPGTALYGAAKSALTTFMHSLDGEVRGTGIRVAVLYPMGAVDTPANRRDMPNFDPAGYIDPVEIAETLLFAATRGPRARLLDLAVYPGR